MTRADTILSPMELEAITGYRAPACQLRVVLERPHYDAVCRGQDSRPQAQARPVLQPSGWKRAA